MLLQNALCLPQAKKRYLRRGQLVCPGCSWFWSEDLLHEEQPSANIHQQRISGELVGCSAKIVLREWPFSSSVRGDLP